MVWKRMMDVYFSLVTGHTAGVNILENKRPDTEQSTFNTGRTGEQIGVGEMPKIFGQESVVVTNVPKERSDRCQ